MHATKTYVIAVAGLVAGGALVLPLVLRGQEEVAAAGVTSPEIILYSEPNFEGDELRITQSEPDLPVRLRRDGSKILLNDSVQSVVVVSGTWRLYQHGRLNTSIDKTPRAQLDLTTKSEVAGWSNVLSATSRGPLKIASVQRAAMDKDISSVQLISPENLPDWMFYGRR